MLVLAFHGQKLEKLKFANRVISILQLTLHLMLLIENEHFLPNYAQSLFRYIAHFWMFLVNGTQQEWTLLQIS